MPLSVPNNPVLLNELAPAPVSTGLVIDTQENQTRINQIHGIAPNNAIGAGIPKQVSNVSVSVANAQAGSTCTASVFFSQDPSDKNFSGINVWIKGYQGNNNLVQVGSGNTSPTKIVLNNTGEIVSFFIQAYGNGGGAPLANTPNASSTLPKSVLGGFGTSSTVYTNSPPTSSTVGALSIAAPVNVVTNPTVVNISTEGTKDWFVLAGSNAAVPIDSDTAVHWKLLGGWIRRLFSWWGPTGTITIPTTNTSVFQLTTNIGDDAQLGNTRTNNFLNADTNAQFLQANNGLAFSNWGFRIGALAGKTARTLKIYFLFNSGGGATNNQLTITARLEDGSAADATITLTPGVTGILYYTMSITFNASAEGVPLFVMFNVIQNTGDSGTRVGFQAATCF